MERPNDYQEFENNSNAAREKRAASEQEASTVTPVVKGSVKTRKPPLRKKFANAFVDEEAGSVKDYLIFDLIVPGIKNLVLNGITQSLEMIFWGSTGGSRPVTRGGGNGSYIAYNRVSSGNRVQNEPKYATKRGSYDIEDIIFDSMSDAEDVLSKLYEILEDYQRVSVADYYSACGISSSYTDRYRGWESLAGSRVSRYHGGYVIDLPRCRKID